MRPFTLLIKPSGSDCNIDCTYCFYKRRAPEIGTGRQRMSIRVLEAMTRDYLRLGFPASSFSWQGGEPLLMGLEFFQAAVAFQNQYAQPDQQISNALQTNGILLDDAWAVFLKQHQFLVGISCDGPSAMHDRFRKDLGGQGTWERVLKGIETGQRHELEFNVLVLVHRDNVDQPDAVLDFFLDRGIRWLQFIPCVERDPQTGRMAAFSVAPGPYGDFLCRVFDRWLKIGPTSLSIRDFDSLVHHCVSGQHTLCTFGRQCADYIVVEHGGDVYPCDFFVSPDRCLGHLRDNPIGQMADGAPKRAFARQKTRLASKCLVCAYLDVCRGGCVKDRISPEGPPDASRPSYLCDSYKTFFAHALPRVRQLAAQIRADMSRPVR